MNRVFHSFRVFFFYCLSTQAILRFVPLVWLSILAMVLFAGLKPLRFHPPNGARWIVGQRGIRFERPRGLVFSQEPLNRLLGGCRSGCGIEMLVSPAITSTDGSSYILNDDDLDHGPHLAIFQGKADVMLMSWFKDQSTPSPRIGVIGTPNVFKAGQLMHIAITSGPGRTELYVDGRLGSSTPSALDVDRFTGRVLLGGTGSCESTWFGDLLALAFYDRPLSTAEILTDSTNWKQAGVPRAQSAVALYTFAERGGEQIHPAGDGTDVLEIPLHLVVLHHVILEWSLSLTREGILDVVVNVVGLLPFGFMTMLLLRAQLRLTPSRALVLTVVITALLSLAIELTQVYIPGRDSSSTDLLMNIIGGTLGALVLCKTPIPPPRSAVS